MMPGATGTKNADLNLHEHESRDVLKRQALGTSSSGKLVHLFLHIYKSVTGRDDA